MKEFIKFLKKEKIIILIISILLSTVVSNLTNAIVEQTSKKLPKDHLKEHPVLFQLLMLLVTVVLSFGLYKIHGEF